MESRDILFPYLITHGLSLLLIFICFKWLKIGKAAWAVIFIAAGLFNVYSVISNSQQYVTTYGQYAIPLYQKFIFGLFSANTILFVVLIAAGQILVGSFLFMKKMPLKLGVLAGVIFLIAISPLGIGSAFPSTLLMAFSLVLMYKRYHKLIRA